MENRQLKDKAINLKGKQYVLVADRISYFNDTYADGCITTLLISNTDAELVVFKAVVTPNIKQPERFFTGHSQAKWGDGFVNKTSALENAETSAVGRALAMMGIGVIDSVASVDEIKKAEASKPYTPTPKTLGDEDQPLNDKIKGVLDNMGIVYTDETTVGQARQLVKDHAKKGQAI